MILELQDQVCTLEQSKRLKELGVTQESQYYWLEMRINGEHGFRLTPAMNWRYGHFEENEDVSRALDGDSKNEIYAAFSVAELGELLPFYLVNIGELKIGKNYVRDQRTGWNATYVETVNCKRTSYFPTICYDVLAECMAALLLYLLQHNHINPR